MEVQREDEGRPAAVPSAGDRRPQLRRSRDDRVLFGVCGGLGRYVGVDPVLVRVAFVLLAVFGGSGVVLYVIAAIAIADEQPGDMTHKDAPGTIGAPATLGAPAVVVGGLLVVLGSLMLANRVVPEFGMLFGPLLLIAIGAAVLLAGRR